MGLYGFHLNSCYQLIQFSGLCDRKKMLSEYFPFTFEHFSTLSFNKLQHICLLTLFI